MTMTIIIEEKVKLFYFTKKEPHAPFGELTWSY